MLDSSEPILLTKADLSFLIGEMLFIGQDHRYWCASFLKRCILRTWLSAEDAERLWQDKHDYEKPPGTIERWQDAERLVNVGSGTDGRYDRILAELRLRQGVSPGD